MFARVAVAQEVVEQSEGQNDALLVDAVDTLGVDSISVDTLAIVAPNVVRPRSRSMIDDVMRGKNRDSLYYDVIGRKIYIYNEGEVSYQDMQLKADNMRIDMESNEIYAYGSTTVDSLSGSKVVTKPEFIDGASSYKMDTITYNIKSEKAMIKGVATKEGEGWLVGSHVKRMPDNTINIRGGKYTTCDHTDHPHFYLAMTKAKVIPGEKVITGPAYLVLEDVPLYFLGIPEGFFPLHAGPRSGILMPSYGEDGMKGFFIRDLGYYITVNDYIDLTLRAGIYTYGSWEASAASSYLKKYKYSGGVSATFAATKTGDKGEPDYIHQNNFKIQWTHSQDPKANPGSTFSASVNLATSGYSKYSATSLNDMLATQTNSSIAYSKNWSGTPFSFSTNMAVSQNSQAESISVTFPSAVFNMSTVYPFKSKTSSGDKWYEKISVRYTGKLTNSVTTTESELFERSTLDAMSSGVSHAIPVEASFSLFNYINLTPNFSYNERWYFQQNLKEWNPETNMLDELDPKYGFYRLYDYSTSVTTSTIVYGMYQAKKRSRKLQAIRHTLTPSLSFSYTPDFSRQKYGYYNTVQSDSLGTTMTYSPFTGNAYGVPSSGQSMAMSGSLQQRLEIKVASKRDSTGLKKITLIDNFGVSASYNFLADSMKLSSAIPVTFRTTAFGNFGINLSVTLDPYKVSPEGVRYDELFFPGRVTSTSWSYGYTFTPSANRQGSAINDITTAPPEYTNPFYDPYGHMDPVLRRQYMASSYYDFNIPWNFGFNYLVSYGVSYVNNGTTGYEPNITQTIGFNGSVTLTDKWGVTFTGGYDIMNRKLTTSSISISRDLHCWQMSMSIIPYGFYRSWSFNIGVKSSALADLKYDKSQSMYDNMY